MRRFTQNWINFFRNCDVSSDKLEQVYLFISQFTSSVSLKATDISLSIQLTDYELENILTKLEESGIIQINVICPFCKKNLIVNEYHILTCPDCDSEINIKELPSITLKKDVSQENYLKKRILEETYELNAKMLFSSGISEGYLYYIATDIENSQLIQKEQPDEYLKILDSLWHTVWADVFRQSYSAYLPVLARGDAVSIVYSSASDAINTIFRIAEQKVETKVSLFINKILFKKKDMSAFMRSLDGKWDLNLDAVTDLYRISHNVKPSTWLESNNYFVKFAILDDMIEESLKYLTIKYNEEEYKFKDKHCNDYRGKLIAGVC